MTMTDTASSRAAEYARQTSEQAGRGAGGEHSPTRREVNVGLIERIGTGAVGAMLTFWGLMLLARRGSVVSGMGLAAAGAGLAYRGASGHCPAYQRLGMESEDASATSHPLGRFVHASRKVRINRPADELYDYWHNIENLPTIMRHLKNVKAQGDGQSHWTATAPRGGSVTWDAEITEDRPGEYIAWCSAADADVPNYGHVRFESLPHGQGTAVEVDLHYRPPAGVVGAMFAYAFGEAPRQQLREDLRRFKQTMETGEIATTAGQPRGRCR